MHLVQSIERVINYNDKWVSGAGSVKILLHTTVTWMTIVTSIDAVIYQKVSKVNVN